MVDKPRTPEDEQRWRDALVLLDRLLALPEGDRDAALADIADPAQRSLLQAWLQCDADGGGVLDAELIPRQGKSTLQGRQLGRWRLDEEIGRGGMAVVWRAESTAAPVGQPAAVKILSLGALIRHDGAERFVQEQRLLSRMRHPNIAALFDAGIAADGTPWFAMALVDGVRIDAWCERRDSDLDARVGLLLQVCDAVSYAHRNLVIHRDIKPSNVLVDEEGHVRLMDFGIARLSDDASPERTVTALRMLTPEYAAPEQFSGAPASTAMDVYGLGALLYRLLSGLPPRKGAPEAADPPTLPPSRAVRADAARDARQREQLVRRLRGDLDTIVMKALSAEPEQRYASVDALAEDLRRWRDTRPIRARAPTLRYRAGRFIARNRWGVAAASALVLALAGGMAGIAWQGEQARRQAERAELTRQFLRDVFSEANPLHRGGRQSSIEGVLRDAAQQARERFAARPDMQVDTLRLVGELQALNGDNRGALESLQTVHALQQVPGAGWDDARRSDVIALASAHAALGEREASATLLQHWLDEDAAHGASARHCKGHSLLANAADTLPAGLAIMEAAREACLALPATTPERVGAVATLAMLRRVNGDWEGAQALVEQALPSLPPHAQLPQALFIDGTRLMAEHAYILRRQREYDSAEAVVRDTLATAEARLGRDSPLLVSLLNLHGVLLNVRERPADAAAAFERALSLVESHGEVQYALQRASLFNNLGIARYKLGDGDAAEAAWRQAMQAYRDADMAHHSDYGALFSNLAVAMSARGAHAEAADMARQSVEFLERESPARLDQIALAQFNWCIAAAHVGDVDAAAHCERGAELDLRYSPDNVALHGEGQQYIADAHCLLGQWPAALAAADRAIALLAPLLEQGQEDVGGTLYLAHHHRAEALARLGRRTEARTGITGPDFDGVGPPLRTQPQVLRARKAVGLSP